MGCSMSCACVCACMLCTFVCIAQVCMHVCMMLVQFMTVVTVNNSRSSEMFQFMTLCSSQHRSLKLSFLSAVTGMNWNTHPTLLLSESKHVININININILTQLVTTAFIGSRTSCQTPHAITCLTKFVIVCVPVHVSHSYQQHEQGVFHELSDLVCSSSCLSRLLTRGVS